MDKIDIMKEKLNEALEERSIDDNEVLSISRQLDLLIVEHIINNSDLDFIIDDNKLGINSQIIAADY